MPKNSLNVSPKGADDIFSTEESRQEQQREQVQQIPIGELFPFKNHPFKVLDDYAHQAAVRPRKRTQAEKRCDCLSDTAVFPTRGNHRGGGQ